MDYDFSGPWFWLFLALAFILPLLALLHILRNMYRGRNRLIWVLIIVFLPIFGSMLYFIMGKKYQKENP